MKIIVGLGNPGKEYELTRHNIGFIFVDLMVKRKELSASDKGIAFNNNKKFNSDIAETSHKGEKIIFAKPKTFMNLSGDAISSLMAFYKCETRDLVVVSDDVDLPVGTVRIRKGGASGGHNGLQNIIDKLGEDDFYRVRIGISRPVEKLDKIETKEYVLDKIGDRDLPLIGEISQEAISYLLKYLGQKEEIPAHTLELIK